MVATGNRLENKSAIITGAGSGGDWVGTGQAIALTFARQGAKVALVDINRDAVQRTHDQIGEEGGESTVILADVTKGPECAGAVEAAISTFGNIDILVNNVGEHHGGSVVTIPESEWDRIMDLNVKSMFWMGKYCLPHMIEQGSGALVNLSTIAAVRGFGGAAHAASKAAVIGLTIDQAVGHARQGIRANCIIPGHLFTPMGMVGQDPEAFEEFRRYRRDSSPLGIEGSGWDVAWAAVYLASDESRYVTGVCLPVDAGVTIATHSSRRYWESDLGAEHKQVAPDTDLPASGTSGAQ